MMNGHRRTEHVRFSSNREHALSPCLAAIPDAKPLRTFAGIALGRRLRLGFLALACAIGIATPALATDFGLESLPTDRLVKPDGKIAGIVVLLSDGNGWSPDEDRVTADLIARGALVVGVDLPTYYAALRRIKDDCLYLVADVEKLSKDLHRREGLDTYHPPVLMGLGDGATLALAMTAQSPDATIAETLAVNPGALIPLETQLCTPAPKTPVAGGISYGLTPGNLPQPVTIALGNDASAEGRAQVAALKQTHPAITVMESNSPGVDVLEEQGVAAFQRQAAASQPLDLPIVVIDAEPRFDTMAIIYSGDGGWRDIDQQIGAYLEEAGVPVVGVDALRYFWSEKSPEQTASDLSRIIAVHKARWKVSKVVLVGYSFGANVLPATYIKLPPDDQRSVSFLSLLALSHAADFEIAVTGWLGVAGAAKHGDPVDHLAGIEAAKIQCIEGDDDDESACPALRPRVADGVEIVTREGGHHFDGDYRALTGFILDRIKGAAK